MPPRNDIIANIKGTPAFILMLINVHVFPKPDLSSEFNKQCIAYCKREKLIQMATPTRGGPEYSLTDRGLAFLKMLQDTPLPSVMQVCADPRTGEQVGSFVVPEPELDYEDGK